MLVALLTLLVVPSARGAWVIGDQTTASSLSTEKLYVIESASCKEALGAYLKAGTTSRPTVVDSLCIWQLEAAGINEVTNEQMYYLKNFKTGEYMNSAGTTTADKTQAWTLLFHGASCEDMIIGKDTLRFSSAEKSGYTAGWDANSITIATCAYEKDEDDGSEYISVNFLANYWNDSNAYWSYRDTNGWNFYEVTNDNDTKADLQAVIDEYDAGSYATKYKGSDSDPFTVKMAVYQTLVNTYEESLNLLNDETQYDAEVYTAQVIKLRAAIDACEDSENVNPLVEGYYYIKTANTNFTANAAKPENANMAWYVADDATGRVQWKMLDTTDPGRFLWYIVPSGEELTPKSATYSIQNMGTGVYVDGPASDAASQNYKTATSNARLQVIYNRGAGQISLRPKGNTSSYGFAHQGGHGGGAGTSGNIVTWSYGLGGGSSWRLEKETNEAFIDSIRNAMSQKILDNNLASLISTGKTKISNATKYKFVANSEPLVTNYQQLSVNNPEKYEGYTEEQMYKNLIDGNHSTYLHTSWSSSSDVDSAYHYILVESPEELPSSLQVFWWRRHNNNNNRPTKVAVSVSSDSLNWNTIDTLTNLPTAAADSFYVSPALSIPSGNTMIRFQIITTNNGATSPVNGFPFFTFSEFNLYTSAEKAVDPSTSQSARPEVAAKLTVLQEAVTAAEAIEKGTTTQEDVDKLQAALDAFESVWADTTDLVALIAEAKTQAENAVPYDSEDDAMIGQFPQTAIENVLAAAEAAEAKRPLYALTKEQVDAETSTLEAALKAFVKSMVVPKAGEWYNIISDVSVENRPEDSQPTRGHVIYAGGLSDGSEILWGGLAADMQENARSGWEFINLGDTAYAIRNVGSGWYMGEGGSAGTTVKLSDSIVPYEFVPQGQGQVALRPINNPIKLHAQWAGKKLVNWNAGVNSASSWTFEPVDEDAFTDVRQYAPNRYYIVTLPYRMTEMPFTTDGTDVSFYTLSGAKKDDSGVITELYFEDAPAYGLSPEIAYLMEIGAPATTDATTVGITFPVDLENKYLSTTAVGLNGMQGTYSTKTISQKGLAYFTADGIKTTDGETEVTIDAQQGYIEAASINSIAVNYTLTIPVEGGLINKINNTVVAGNEKVNVYTIDGVLVKKNVKAATATQGLAKGLYIVGTKKLIVK